MKFFEGRREGEDLPMCCTNSVLGGEEGADFCTSIFQVGLVGFGARFKMRNSWGFNVGALVIGGR